ncbi:helix-turn-helix domain-containing protein [Actinoplanes sp. G11-F43]|uniref:helix-turn-helix domain-containing protein n=1 Tax=Actinoplanes sp. G11-F43 TaxID=3424130 RepID=UPI003D34BD5B
MKDLAVRLAALDADASAAVRVIAYFDGLVEAGAGLQSIVRGAAVLAGCPARLDDTARRVHIRMLPDGVAAPVAEPAAADWPHLDLGTAGLWLERSGTPGPVDAMVLERAAGAARTVLDRTRGRAPAAGDPALAELLVDASAPPESRLLAGRRLGLEGSAYALVEHTGEVAVRAATADPAANRAGIGPTVPVLELPASYRAALIAVRFTAAGTDDDPGEPVVRHDELGALAVLASVPDPGAVPDVLALDQAAATAPWLPATLYAITTTSSLRAAATRLRLHHSSLQDRVTQAEHLLGWSLHDPHGLLRARLALTLRHLHRMH